MTDLDWLIDDVRGVPVRPRDADVGEPMLYTEFVAELGFRLDPGQRVFARVCFDGVDPVDLPPDERELARVMFGPIDRFNAVQRAVVLGVCGGRAGKTRMFAMRVLHLALIVPLPDLAPGEIASAPLIAPDTDLATQPLDYIKGACWHRDILPLVVNRRHLSTESEGVDLRRDDGKVVEIVCRAASARGRTGRGRTLVCGYLDEVAIMYDRNYKVCDDEVYKAVRPRVVPGGQTLLGTTPWTQTGLAYELFAANHGAPSVAGLDTPARLEGTALVAHAPTLTLRDNADIRAMVASESTRDPENAAREFGAQFMGAGAETFFEAACIKAAVDYDLPAETMPTPGSETTAGADLGFSNNSSSLAIAHRTPDESIEVGFLREWKPEPGKPLKPSAVCKEMAIDLRRHGATVVMSDAHYRETFVEHMTDAGLGFLDAPTVPAEAYIRARTLMREGRVKMPEHARLIRMMRETIGKKTAGGGVQINKPRWKTGEHADLLDAFVLALYQVAGELVRAEAPKPGTREYNAAYEAARLEARVREVSRGREPFWKRGVKRP